MKTFSKIVYSTARKAGGKVVALHEPCVTPNFYAAEVELLETKVFVLASLSDKWAFSQRFEPYVCSLQFVDCPAIAEALEEEYGITPLSKAELDGKFEKQPYMSEADIRCWHPETLGEGMFNWWD